MSFWIKHSASGSLRDFVNKSVAIRTLSEVTKSPVPVFFESPFERELYAGAEIIHPLTSPLPTPNVFHAIESQQDGLPSALTYYAVMAAALGVRANHVPKPILPRVAELQGVVKGSYFAITYGFGSKLAEPLSSPFFEQVLALLPEDSPLVCLFPQDSARADEWSKLRNHLVFQHDPVVAFHILRNARAVIGTVDGLASVIAEEELPVLLLSDSPVEEKQLPLLRPPCVSVGKENWVPAVRDWIAESVREEAASVEIQSFGPPQGILFFGEESEDFLGLASAFNDLGYSVERCSLNDFRSSDSHDENVYVNLLERFGGKRFQLVMVFLSQHIDPLLIPLLNSLGRTWCWDSGQRADVPLDQAKEFVRSSYFCSSPLFQTFQKFFEMTFNSHQVLPGVNFLKPKSEHIERAFDVLVVSPKNERSERLVQTLSERFRVSSLGDGWVDSPLLMSEEEQVSLLRQSRIVLHPFDGGEDGLRKILFSLINGSFVITSSEKDLGRFFNDEEHLVFLDSENQLEELISKYLENSVRRGKIASAGQRFARERFSWMGVANYISRIAGISQATSDQPTPGKSPSSWRSVFHPVSPKEFELPAFGLGRTVTEHNLEGVTAAFNELVKELNVEPDAFFDFGPGHPGTESWLFRERYSGKVFGFEPNINRFKELRKSFPGVLVNCAVGNESGFLSGYSGITPYPEPNCDFKFSEPLSNIERYDQVEIEVLTLDQLDAKYGPFNDCVIWADIEGSELRMLQGGTKILSEKRIQALLLEVSSAEGWYSEEELVEFLKTFGYHCKRKVGGDQIFVRMP